jgi:hypothetical protein
MIFISNILDAKINAERKVGKCEGSKGVIRNHKSKGQQYNGQNGKAQKDKQ